MVVSTYPLYTLEGVKDANVSTHYFSTEDLLGLSMLRFNRGPSGDAVLIIYGLTISSDMHETAGDPFDDGIRGWCALRQPQLDPRPGANPGEINLQG